MADIPVDVTIIPLSPPEENGITWIAKCYTGVVVLDIVTRQPITAGGLRLGDKVLAPTFSGYCEAEVKLDSRGSPYAETEHTLFLLEFDKDDRHCWVSSGAINKACLDRIELNINVDTEEGKGP